MNRQLIEDAITRLVIAVSTAGLLWLPALATIRVPLVDALSGVIPNVWAPMVTAAGPLTISGIACIVFASLSAAEQLTNAYTDRRQQNTSVATDPMGDPS